MTKHIENLRKFIDFGVSRGLFTTAQAVVAVKDAVEYAEALEANVELLMSENERLRSEKEEVKGTMTV
jgi:hypothetical protein